MRPHSQSASGSSSERHQMIEARPERGRGAHAWLWVLALILALASLAIVLTLKSSTGRLGSDFQQEVTVAAQHFLQQRFEAGVKLRYPAQQWITASSTKNEYTVSGWLEATTRDGVQSGTYEYTCVLGRNSDGEWYLANLNLSPQ